LSKLDLGGGALSQSDGLAMAVVDRAAEAGVFLITGVLAMWWLYRRRAAK
jgi:hypothetical protein